MLRVGTDCSGIEAPIQALKQLGIPFRHVFSCEKDKYAVESIKANYEPEIIFNDMTKRKISQVPDIDLYVCGFPCQPFSHAGKREGTNDPRGNIFKQCLKVIKAKLPKVFILENVKGILSIDDGRTFENIINALNKIKRYNIQWKVLNTRDYGIPQNRERVFIVGILDNSIEFEWPKEKKMMDIKNFVDWNDTEKDNIPSHIKKSKILSRIPKDSIFIDLNFTKATFPNSNIYSPCILAQQKLWCVPLHRKATIKELLSLQGFPKNFKQVVSTTQMTKQIGNSMSVNVLKELFRNI